MTIWSPQWQVIGPGTVRAIIAGRSAAAPLSYREVIRLWSGSPEFRAQFTAWLSSAGFSAYFWETPPLCEKSADQPFEFVLVESSGLDHNRADPGSFSAQFPKNPEANVMSFLNLGGDATLIVPLPRGPDRSCYAHLARFMREAPSTQTDDFWKLTGETLERRVSAVPLWLSTAGLGVPWLHLRIDSRPKYYRYSPYARRA